MARNLTPRPPLRETGEGESQAGWAFFSAPSLSRFTEREGRGG